MSKIVIKKRINLGFLGDEYAQAELVLRSVPASEFAEIMDDLPTPNPDFVRLMAKSDREGLNEVEQSEFSVLQASEAESNKTVFKTLLGCLKRYFYSGRFPDDKTGELVALDTADDLDGLDKDAVIECFNILTGQNKDPKEESTSLTPSTMDQPPPMNS